MSHDLHPFDSSYYVLQHSTDKQDIISFVYHRFRLRSSYQRVSSNVRLGDILGMAMTNSNGKKTIDLETIISKDDSEHDK